MADYRLYFMTTSGRIEGLVEFSAAADEEAIRTAETHRNSQAMELWFSGRKVRRWEAEPPGGNA